MKYLYHQHGGPGKFIFIENTEDYESYFSGTEAIDANLRTKVDEALIEQRIQEAEHMAMDAMPDFAEDIIEDVDYEGGLVRDNDPEKLKKNTARRIWDVLEGRRKNVDVDSDWEADKYQKTVQKIEHGRAVAETEVENVERALAVLTNLRGQYEAHASAEEMKREDTRQYQTYLGRMSNSVFDGLGLNVGIARFVRGKIPQTKENKGFMRRKRVGEGIEKRDFQARNALVLQIFEDIQAKLAGTKEGSDNDYTASKEKIKTSFDILSVDQKNTFLQLVQNEVADPRRNDILNSFDRSLARLVVGNISQTQRLRAYKELGLDQTQTVDELDGLTNEWNDVPTQLAEHEAIIQKSIFNIPSFYGKLGLSKINEAVSMKDVLHQLEAILFVPGEAAFVAALAELKKQKKIPSPQEKFIAYCAYMEKNPLEIGRLSQEMKNSIAMMLTSPNGRGGRIYRSFDDLKNDALTEVSAVVQTNKEGIAIGAKQFELLQRLQLGSVMELSTQSTIGKGVSKARGLTLFEKSENAFLFESGNDFYVVQKSSQGHLQVLQFKAPKDYVRTNKFPKDFKMPTTAQRTGSLISINVTR